MNQDELLARLNGFEWNDFECKRAQRGVPDDAYKTVSAFANTAGGWLVFGVKLMDLVGLKDRTSRSLPATALESGLLEMTIADKPQSSKQRYRLTAQGQATVAKGDA
jgi:predicted HTH transcriptional regulator